MQPTMQKWEWRKGTPEPRYMTVRRSSFQRYYTKFPLSSFSFLFFLRKPVPQTKKKKKKKKQQRPEKEKWRRGNFPEEKKVENKMKRERIKEKVK